MNYVIGTLYFACLAALLVLNVYVIAKALFSGGLS